MKILRLLLIAPFFTFAALAADSSTPAAAPAPPAPGKIAPPEVVQAADPAAVDAVLKALHYDEMMGKALVQQRQMVQQMMVREHIPGAPKDVAAFQQKTMDAAFAGLTVEEIHAVAARNYGETFTTDEMRSIADFYNSPAGQAFATKRAQADLKIGGTIRPRMMEAMQKIQQMTRDFVAQQQAKAEEDAAKAAAAKTKDEKASGAPTAPATGMPGPMPHPSPLPPKS